MTRRIVAIILAALFMGAGGWLWFKHEKRAGHNVSGYKTFKVTRGTVVESIMATGEIRPATGAEISLGARITGTVIEEPIKLGDHVKKGDLIAIIDNRELRALLESARAQVKKTIDSYEPSIEQQRLEIKRLRLGVKNAKEGLASAKAGLIFAKWNRQSRKMLFEGRFRGTSERDYREAEKMFVQAKARLKQARNDLKSANLALSKGKSRLAQLESEYKHDLAIARENLKRAQINYSYSILRAPFDGIITYVSTQEGETVVAGLNAPQFVKILNPRLIEDRIYIDETDIGKVKVGMPVTFTVDAYPGRSFKGKIAQIYPRPVLQNNVVYYLAVVTGFVKGTGLRLQMTTHNTIIVRRLKNVIIVPNEAVKYQDGRYVVFVRKGNRQKTVGVEIGASDTEHTEIIKGLAPGEVVLYKG